MFLAVAFRDSMVATAAVGQTVLAWSAVLPTLRNEARFPAAGTGLSYPPSGLLELSFHS